MINFTSGDVWSTLRAATKRSARPADVAVAYFGKGAAKLLSLPKLSRLVVDASAAAVKSGQTHPADLKQMVVKKHVLVYSVSNLHAKVFVVGSTAYVGSANVSNHSANTLIEALVATTDPEVVKAAREFIRSLCLQTLRPDELDRLQDIYRPPRTPAFQGARSSNRKRSPILSRVRIVQLERETLPKGGKDEERVREQAAEKRMNSRERHQLDNFFWTGKCPVEFGDNVLQVTKEDSGRRLIDPPARVIHKHVWMNSGTKYTFVYVERPVGRRLEMGKLARKIGAGARKPLRRNGVVSKQFAERLLAAWGG